MKKRFVYGYYIGEPFVTKAPSASSWGMREYIKGLFTMKQRIDWRRKKLVSFN